MKKRFQVEHFDLTLLCCYSYLLMKNCWDSSPEERPTFQLLTKQLEHFAGRLAHDGVKFEYLPESNC